MTLQAERPLVTFALFAYNQEAFIREAVEGAFSQTYEPLEIILSDDCSSDRTFAIMQEMAAAYDGPHRVRVRRNKTNIGLIKHCNVVFSEVKAEIIILAAGDDISLPVRVEKLVERFSERSDVFLVHSKALKMNRAGALLDFAEPPTKEDDPEILKLAVRSSIYIGATGAIRSRLVRDFGEISENETYEDIILGFRARLLGNLSYIDLPLVKYRVDVGISFQHSDKSLNRRVRRLKSIVRQIATVQQRISDLSKATHSEKRDIARVLQVELARNTARWSFYRDKRSFLRGLFSAKPYWYFRAAYAETKFLLGIID